MAAYVLVVGAGGLIAAGPGGAVGAARRGIRADGTPPVVRVLTPARPRPLRFVVLSVRDTGSGVAGVSLSVNGRRVRLGDGAARGRMLLRARLGWEPGRLYRIRLSARDRAGDVRAVGRSIRARHFGIAALAVHGLTRARAAAGAAGCGSVHLRPRGLRLGQAPLALGDSVMLGAAWRLARSGIEADTKCGRSPAAGLYVLRRRRRRGTLPRTVVVGLGTNSPTTSRQIAAMLRLLGRRRKLMLVTPHRSWRAVNGGPMLRAARRHPRRVELIDWSRLARRHPAWLWGDGTHLRPGGLPGYTRLLARAVWAQARGQYVLR